MHIRSRNSQLTDFVDVVVDKGHDGRVHALLALRRTGHVDDEAVVRVPLDAAAGVEALRGVLVLNRGQDRGRSHVCLS